MISTFISSPFFRWLSPLMCCSGPVCALARCTKPLQPHVLPLQQPRHRIQRMMVGIAVLAAAYVSHSKFWRVSLLYMYVYGCVYIYVYVYVYVYTYIYMVPPPSEIYLRAFWYTVSTCIYIIYLCAYMYKSQLFFKDVLWVVAVHTIKTSWKQKKNNIWRLFWRESMGKTQKNKKPRENQQKTIFGDSLGKLYWQNQKNLEKTKKNKKTKLFRECLVWGSCLVFFWFCLCFFWFFVGLDLEKTKKTQCFFCFLDKMMVKELWKTKKNQGFFLFLGVCGFSFFLVAQWKTKKKPWVFLVFHTALTIILSKKPKKTLSFF